MDRIWFDKRTRKYHATVQIQDGTERVRPCDTEGEIQLVWLKAAYALNGVKPSKARIPETELLESPDPFKSFSTEELAAEVERRKQKPQHCCECGEPANDIYCDFCTERVGT